MVSASHSVYLEGGILKILSDEERDLLYVYVRPQVLDGWVAAGGGGGNQADPWQHKSHMFWALGDENGRVRDDAPRKEFSFLFDSRDMKLTLESTTYAVRRGGFVVVTLDEDWQPSLVGWGIDSLSVFDLPEPGRERLISAARRYCDGS